MNTSFATNIPAHWRLPLLALLLVTLASVGIFLESWRSIVTIWIDRQTYTHGFLVAPISLWLIWQRKHLYQTLQPEPNYWATSGILLCGFVWSCARLTEVLVVEQWAVVGILISAYWLVLGSRVFPKMLFPMLFLLMMVPFGEDFVPFLMEYTATFTVALLRLTGVTVYREGLHFSLTSGNWSVVDACSGIRYLIASITLGLVYAYMQYSSFKKRSFFILAAVLVPILANGLRAYMIVMIGHLSSMKLATGVDHIIYGWLFFGLVMLILFYIGSLWQDPPIETHEDANATTFKSVDQTAYLSASLIVLLLFSVWPLATHELQARQSVQAAIPNNVILASSTPTENLPAWGWQPKFRGVMADKLSQVIESDVPVVQYLANFGNESQGGELVNSQNRLLSADDKAWRIVHSNSTSIAWTDHETRVEETALAGPNLDLLVFKWFRIGQINTANPYYAKGLQLLKRLSADATPELIIVIYTETPHGDYAAARARLKKAALRCCG